MFNYNKESKLQNFKYTCIEFYNKNKVIIFVLGILLLIALLTGIFTSIKMYNLDNDMDFDKFSMYSLVDGSIYTFKNCLLRMLSSIIIVTLLFVFSLNGFLSVFGYMLIIYRAFLIALNCTFIVITMGLGGVIGGLIIVLPCQLVTMILTCFIFILFINMKKEKKKCGFVDRIFYKKLLILLTIILLVNLLECVLLFIFKPTTILII